MSNSSQTISTAIIIGSALIAAGLYYGLRQPEPPPPAQYQLSKMGQIPVRMNVYTGETTIPSADGHRVIIPRNDANVDQFILEALRSSPPAPQWTPPATDEHVDKAWLNDPIVQPAPTTP
jgi:hypothetical protein